MKMHDGIRESMGFEEVCERFEQPPMRYAPYQFWFWDQTLSTLGIKPTDMARELYEKGMNPGYAHARINYAQEFRGDHQGVSAIEQKEWLTDAWFDALESVLRQSRADGSCFSVADDFGWPSLQAGGRVLEQYPDMRARSLRYEIRDVRGGERVVLPAADFTVCAKLIRTENTSYVEFAGDGWREQHASFDASRPCETQTQPYNFSARFQRDSKAAAIFHPFFAHGGSYALYARWSEGGDNADCVCWEIRRDERVDRICADQRAEAFRWKRLGTFEFEEGASAVIAVSNAGRGEMCVDAIRLENVLDRNDFIVIDDQHTLNRTIGWLDARTLEQIADRSGSMDWRAPEGMDDYRVYSFTIETQRGYDGSLVDNLDARLGERFVKIAYRPYGERLERFMGSGAPMNGIFADTEGGYGFKLAWSKDLETRFAQRTGESLRKWLPLMIDMDEGGLEAKVRFEWYDAVSDLFAENFSAPARYAQEHGMYYTMHTWEESLPFQANQVGDYFKLSRTATLPGTDCLMNVAYNPANFWDTMSVAEFDGKRYMAEMMALAGLDAYNMSELKRQANDLAAWGVSHVITHSLKMTRALAQEVVTPDFYNVDPAWKSMREWADYVRRTSFVNACGHLTADVLLVNPMDSIWALTDGANMDPSYDMTDTGGGIPAGTASHGGRASEINRVYHETIRQLVHARVAMMTADKQYLREMQLCGDRLTRGKHAFRTVVLPPMTVMDAEVARKILNFAQAGGRIVSLGELPTGSLQRGRIDEEMVEIWNQARQTRGFYAVDDLEAFLQRGGEALRPQADFIEGAFDLRMMSREIEGRQLIWLANNDDEAHACVLRIHAPHGRVSRWDPVDGRIRPISALMVDGGVELSLRMEACEGFFLAIDPTKSPAAVQIPREETLTVLENGWRARIETGDYAQIERRFSPMYTDRFRLILRKGSFAEPRFARIDRLWLWCGNEEATRQAWAKASSGSRVEAIFEDGNAGWRSEVPMEWDEPQEIVIELSQARNVDGITLQNADANAPRSWRLEGWDGTWWKNLLTVDEAPESSLIQPIEWPEEMLGRSVPVQLTDWRQWKRLDSHFSGSVDYEWNGTIPKAAGECRINLGEVGQTAKLWINGVEAGTKIAPPYDFAIGRLLREGSNEIRVRVSNAIASNAGVAEKRCGLIGPVRVYCEIR